MEMCIINHTHATTPISKIHLFPILFSRQRKQNILHQTKKYRTHCCNNISTFLLFYLYLLLLCSRNSSVNMGRSIPDIVPDRVAPPPAAADVEACLLDDWLPLVEARESFCDDALPASSWFNSKCVRKKCAIFLTPDMHKDLLKIKSVDNWPIICWEQGW